ncbi:MAG: cytidine deaminase [Balneolaceae bacterium]|nr:cytidine deaminase [Balneolaceae bacterium]
MSILESLKNRSYVPYSNSPVSCAVAARSGSLYPGVRIENISFPLTISAVQCALFACLSESEQPETLYIDSSGRDEPQLKFWVETFELTVADAETLDSDRYTPVIVPDGSSGDIRGLLKEGLDRAVVPHSGFPVAAVLVTGRGLISGSNIEPENSAWEMGLCAERVALAKAIAYGITDIRSIHVHTIRGDFGSPCGACRQVIVEHMAGHPLFIHHPDGTTSRHFTGDLLPYSFKSKFLNNLGGQ